MQEYTVSRYNVTSARISVPPNNAFLLEAITYVDGEKRQRYDSEVFRGSTDTEDLTSSVVSNVTVESY